MTIIVLDGQGGGIGRAIISALLPLLPQGAQLLCVGTNAMATAAMLKAGAQRGATGENAVRWAAQNADILIAPIALVLKDSMMGEITGDMAASVGSSRATRILVPTERCGPMSRARTGSACRRWWRTRRGRPRPWLRAREALAFLHNLWLDVAFILPYNKGAEVRRASERAGRRQPFRTRLNITPFSIRRHAKTRNE